MAVPDFCAAARRHYKDGLLLSDHGHLPGADHFFGLSCECAIKAALESAGLLELDAKGKPNKPYDQHCPGIWDQYAIAHGGHANLSRFPLPKANPFIENWHVSDRYAGDGVVGLNDLDVHRSGALEALKLMQSLHQEIANAR